MQNSAIGVNDSFSLKNFLSLITAHVSIYGTEESSVLSEP
jgi:hypothetical protein